MRTFLTLTMLLLSVVARADSAALVPAEVAGRHFVTVRDCGGTSNAPCNVVLMGGRGSARLFCAGPVQASREPARVDQEAERWYFADGAPVTFTCPSPRRAVLVEETQEACTAARCAEVERVLAGPFCLLRTREEVKLCDSAYKYWKRCCASRPPERRAVLVASAGDAWPVRQGDAVVTITPRRVRDARAGKSGTVYVLEILSAKSQRGSTEGAGAFVTGEGLQQELIRCYEPRLSRRAAERIDGDCGNPGDHCYRLIYATPEPVTLTCP